MVPEIIKADIKRPTVSKIKIASRVAIILFLIPPRISSNLCPHLRPTRAVTIIAIIRGIWAAS